MSVKEMEEPLEFGPYRFRHAGSILHSHCGLDACQTRNDWPEEAPAGRKNEITGPWQPTHQAFVVIPSSKNAENHLVNSERLRFVVNKLRPKRRHVEIFLSRSQHRLPQRRRHSPVIPVHTSFQQLRVKFLSNRDTSCIVGLRKTSHNVREAGNVEPVNQMDHFICQPLRLVFRRACGEISHTRIREGEPQHAVHHEPCQVGNGTS